MTAWDWFAAAGRRWYLTALGMVVTTAVLYGILSAPGVYAAQTQVLFLAPVTPNSPNTMSSPTSAVISTAGLVERIVNRGVETSATSGAVSLTGRGVDHGHSIVLPNAGGQWSNNFNRPVLQVQVTAPTAEQVRAEIEALIVEIERTTRELQVGEGADHRYLISTQVSPATPWVAYDQGHRVMALGVAGLLGMLLTGMAVLGADRVLLRRGRNGNTWERTHNIGEKVATLPVQE